MATFIRTVKTNGKDYFYKMGQITLKCGAKSDGWNRISRDEAEFYQKQVGKVTDQYFKGDSSISIQKYDL